MSEPITQSQCVKNQKIMFLEMEKLINKIVTKLKEEIISEITQLGANFDKKYAGKYLEKTVEKIKETREKRNYDWLKYAVMTIMGVAIGKLF